MFFLLCACVRVWKREMWCERRNAIVNAFIQWKLSQIGSFVLLAFDKVRLVGLTRHSGHYCVVGSGQTRLDRNVLHLSLSNWTENTSDSPVRHDDILTYNQNPRQKTNQPKFHLITHRADANSDDINEIILRACRFGPGPTPGRHVVHSNFLLSSSSSPAERKKNKKLLVKCQRCPRGAVCALMTNISAGANLYSS